MSFHQNTRKTGKPEKKPRLIRTTAVTAAVCAAVLVWNAGAMASDDNAFYKNSKDDVQVVLGNGEDSSWTQVPAQVSGEDENLSLEFSSESSRVFGVLVNPEDSSSEGSDEEEPEQEYPAMTFETTTEYVKVSVFAEEGSLPYGTYMIVKDIEDDDTLASISDTVEKDVVKMHAVDITFYNSEDEEIEPLKPLRVIITAEESAPEEEIQVVHVDEEGNAEVVENAAVTEQGGEAQAEFVENSAAEAGNAQTAAESAENEAASIEGPGE